MRREFEVVQNVEVTVDESRFTPEFMEHFNRYFHEKADIGEHMAYIAELVANGAVRSESDFVEGYGKLDEFGISFECGKAEAQEL